MEIIYIIILFFSLPFIMKALVIFIDFLVDNCVEYYEKFIGKNNT